MRDLRVFATFKQLSYDGRVQSFVKSTVLPKCIDSKKLLRNEIENPNRSNAGFSVGSFSRMMLEKFNVPYEALRTACLTVESECVGGAKFVFSRNGKEIMRWEDL